MPVLSGSNHTPVVTGSWRPVYTENAPPVLVNPVLSVSDLDGGTLAGATVRITRSFFAGEDVLAFTAAHGITGSYDAALGVLSLSGTASLADYQEVLRSVTYVNTSDAPSRGSRKLVFQLDDGAASNNLSKESSTSVKVLAVNDAPELSHAGGWLAYPLGETAALVLDATVNVADLDDDRLKSAELQITGGYVRGKEFLDFDGIDGVRLSARFDAASGTLTLRGRATPQQFQEAIRSVTYQNTTGTAEGERTITIRVSDGRLWSDTLEQTVLFAAPPDVRPGGTPAAHTEDGAPTLLDAGIVLADRDGTELAGVRVRIAGGFETGDELVFADMGNITGTWDSETRTLTLSGLDSVAGYQSALRTVGFVSSNQDPSGATKTIEWIAEDDDGNISDPVTTSLAVTPVNDAPVLTAAATSDLAFTEDGAAVAIDAGITLADVDDSDIVSALVKLVDFQPGDTLAYTAGASGITGTYDPATGELALSGSASQAAWQSVLRSIAFDTTEQDPTATRTIEWTIHDGTAASNTVTRSIAITPVNDAPVLSGTSASGFAYLEDQGGLTLDAGISVADLDDAQIQSAVVRLVGSQPGDALNYKAVVKAGPSSSYDAATGELTFTGAADKAIWDQVLNAVSFSTTEQDPTATRTVEWFVNDGADDSEVFSRTITITPVDDMPVSVDDSATLTEDDSATAIDVLANDTDVDGGPQAIASVTQPANGTVVITGGGTGLSYQPNANYANVSPAVDTFTYTLNGGSTATVSVTVNPVDDAPVAVDDTATVTEDAVSAAIDLRANDTDIDAGPLSISSVTQPANGSVSITGGGTGLTYTPNANYANDPPGTTPDTFTYTLNGGSTATVSVTVTAVDDAPVSVNDSATLTEDDGATAIVVLDNDTDVDGGPKSIASASDPAHGTVVLTGGTAGAHTGLSYQPDPDFAGTDTFTYQLNGGSIATVTVTVDAVDDAPAAVGDSVAVDEDSGATTLGVLANDTDIDGGPLTITAVTQPANGTVAINKDGTDISFTPNANYFSGKGGPESFTYTLNGGSTATVEVTVNAVNDAPTFSSAAATSVPEAETAVLSVVASDVENETLGYSITGGADAALFTIDPTTGELNFNAPPDFESPADGGGNNVYDVQVGAFDGTDTSTQDIAVTVTNGAPSTPADTDAAANQVSQNAPIGSTLHLDIDAADAAGGSIHYWLADDADGLFEIDADTGAVKVAGAITYDGVVAANNFKTITVVASDGALETTQDFQIEIIPNTPPTANDDTGSATEAGGVDNASAGANATGNVISGGTPDSDAQDAASALTVTGIRGGAAGTVGAPVAGTYGSLTIQADGSYVYTVDEANSTVQALQAAGTPLADTFTYTVQDTGGLTAEADLVISIGGANDAPTTTAGAAVSGLEDDLTRLELGGFDWDGTITHVDIQSLPAHGKLYLDAGLTAEVTATGRYATYGGPLVPYYLPDADYVGTDSFTWRAVDNSGAAAGNTETVSLTVTAVNDAPSFTRVSMLTMSSEDAGAVTVGGLVKDISAGPSDESGQKVSFTVTNDNNALFSVQPAMDADGVLSYTLAPDMNGGATLTITAVDDGGIADDGIDTSVSLDISLGVTAVNDAPTFSIGAAQSIAEDAGAQTVAGFVSSMSAGPADESGQTLTVTASVADADASMAFSAAPAIDAVTGDLTYTLAADAFGTATIEVEVADNGGFGGASTVKSFTITAANTPDAPVATNDAFPTVYEDTGANTFNVLANDSDPDNVGHTNDGLKITGVSDVVGGTVSFDGGSPVVSFTPAADYAGPASFTYTVEDGTGRTDTATASFTVAPVNDAPAVSVPDDASLATAHSNTVFSLANKVSVSDIDAGSGNVTVTLTAAHGGLTLTQSGSATIGEGTNGTGTVTVSGTAGDVNATLSSLSYKSTDGWTGTETVQVSVNDNGNTGDGGALSASDSFQIGVVEQVVFIDNTDTKADNLPDAGSAANPFNTIAAFNSADVDGTGDYILVKKGTGTYTDDNGIDLQSGQKLFGEGTSFQLTNPVSNDKVTFGTGIASDEATVSLTAVNATAHAVDLSANNTVAGLNFATASANQVGVSDGNATVGNLLVTNVNITGTGAALDIDQGGSLSVSIGTLSSTGAGVNAIDLSGVSGSVSVGSGSISGGSATVVNVANGSVNLSYSGTVSSASTLVNASTHTGNLTFSGGTLSATGGTGLQFSNADGTYQFNGNVTLNGGDAGIDILAGSSGTFSFGQAGSTTTAITNPTGNAFNLGASAANVTYNGSISDNTGYAVAIDDHDAGSVTFQNGSITSTGTGLRVANSNGGSVAFNTQTTLSTGSNTAVDLATSNAGGIVLFGSTGSGLDITTTTATGFVATGGGVVHVTGSGNSITSSAGTALNVSNTTIGSSGMRFESISSSGAVNGIVLNNTGTSGGLNVTGDGGATNNNSGGTIQNTTGDGILLTNTENVRLGYMNITGSDGNGIAGTNVNGLVLNRMNLSANGDSAADDDSGIDITGLTGTASGGLRPTAITNSVFTNNYEFEVQVTNTSGTLSNFQFLNNTVTSNGADAISGNLVNFLGSGTAAMGITATGNTFTGNAPSTATGLHLDTSGTSLTAIVQNNTFTNNNAGINVSTGPGNSTLTYLINANTFTGQRSTAINEFHNGNPTFARTVNGTITNNIIGTQGVANSGSSVGSGINIGNEGAVSTKHLISGNTIQSIGTAGTAGSTGITYNMGLGGIATGAGTANLTITGNTIRDIMNSRGITVQDNQTVASYPTINLSLSGNTFAGTIAGQAGNGEFVRVRELNGTVNLTQQAPTASAIGTEIDDANGFNNPAKINLTTSNTFTYGQPTPTQPVTPTLNLLAAAAPATAMDPADPAQQGSVLHAGTDLGALLQAAIAQWAQAGASEAQIAAMHNATLAVADLGGLALAESGMGLLVLDASAAGWGWFIDPTPLDAAEFAEGAGGGADGRMDLLTVLVHELGHLAGVGQPGHAADAGDVMHDTLDAGTRRQPQEPAMLVGVQDDLGGAGP